MALLLFYNGSEAEGRANYKAFFDIGSAFYYYCSFLSKFIYYVQVLSWIWRVKFQYAHSPLCKIRVNPAQYEEVNSVQVRLQLRICEKGVLNASVRFSE